MTLAALVLLVVKASIVLTVLALGLSTRRGDVVYLFRHPGKLARSLAAMLVVMPLLAAGLAAAFLLHPAVGIALIALAVSPVPPFLPRKQEKAGGRESYAVGLLAATALLSVVSVPLSVTVVGHTLGIPMHLPAAQVGRIVLISVLLPLVVGALVRAAVPTFAQRVAGPVGTVATVLLVVVCVPLVASVWSRMISLLGNATLLAIVILALAGLVLGHFMGGPDPEDRLVLALSTASRHPGVALAVGHAIAPDDTLVMAAVLLSLLVASLVTALYLHRARRVVRFERAADERRESADDVTERRTRAAPPDGTPRRRAADF